jgi:folate-dependent phosphoribosylglycinamide formyltransferase PurN
MNVAVFGSGKGTILSLMLAAQKKETQPFAIRLLYTDRICRFQTIAEEEHLPLIYQPWDPSLSREENDRQGLSRLLAFSPIDCLLLAGYMRLMSSVWLKAFPNRILNIHPADLTVLDGQGRRKYVGKEAVFDALREGERRTRTSAMLIDETVDGGPLLVLGPWVPYEGEIPVTRASAALHQEKQKVMSDSPACLRALQRLAKEEICVESLGS